MPESPSPWHHVGRRTLGNPFASLGDAWCQRCKMEVECDTESSHRNEQYVWSRRCPRCGIVVSWGAYQQVPLLRLTNQTKQRDAIAFVTKPGADRRGPVRGRWSL